jgi:hypothetical protein
MLKITAVKGNEGDLAKVGGGFWTIPKSAINFLLVKKYLVDLVG